MGSIFDIRLQKLFFLTVIFKVGTAFSGWYFDRPWSLGFVVPLCIMVAYIVLGANRRDDDVSDEKFADSCYYLGFIFTITSIIFSLFDLPNIGTKIQDIAVRFGAAMVSTVLGLAVRVYLVSFKKDGADAVQDAEAGVIQASQKFREQLVMAYEKLRDFEDGVDKATRSTVERVNMQVEKLSQDHSMRLASFFDELTKQNQVAFTAALEEVKGASLRLSVSVDRYSLGVQRNLGSIEEKVTLFADAVAGRLKTTTFPDDYFSKNLAQPVAQLQQASLQVATEVARASEEVSQSTNVLTVALKKLKSKSTTAEESLDAVVRLTTTQHAVLDAAQGQLATLEDLGSTLSKLDNLINAVVEGVASNTTASSALAEKVQAVVIDGTATRQEIRTAFTGLTGSLTASAQQTNALGTRLDQSVASNEHVANQVGLAAVATSRVVGKLDAIAAAEAEAAKARAVAFATNDSSASQMTLAVGKLAELVRHLAEIDNSLRSHSKELSHAVTLSLQPQRPNAAVPEMNRAPTSFSAHTEAGAAIPTRPFGVSGPNATGGQAVSASLASSVVPTATSSLSPEVPRFLPVAPPPAS